MARLANLNGVFETLLRIRRLLSILSLQRAKKGVEIVAFLGKKKNDSQEHTLLTTRRLALGLASIALVGKTCNAVSFAEDNDFWIDGRIPLPSVNNKIDNENTDTPSFLKKRIFIADIGLKGRMYRLRKYAFDLLGMEDLIGEDTLNYVQKFIKIKATFMYYNFDKVITAAPVDDKQPLLDLANRLFDNVDKIIIKLK
ncbi:photosynthetic NDH subunit of lumenal location 3, chloroplastic [Cannabis sativa]|uniref:photosynthetic NDH subunit of lumenal location 3, chloroplastic n=1 Tax=Cannabis sativa TaxID=3483 RepID=UPI0029CA2925|nr:photosynthetic NDH subunit of lumenal location 3, chloroplastic [Cannabis sativa]